MVCSPQTVEDFGQSLKGKDLGGIFREESAAKAGGTSLKLGLPPSPLFLWVVGFLRPAWHKEPLGTGPKPWSGKTQLVPLLL